MKKAPSIARLFQIALANTPSNIRYVRVLRQRAGTRAMISEGWIAAQVPSTPFRLWAYLHECKHMEFHDSLALAYYNEIPKTDAEVELAVMKIFDSEKIKMSARFYKERYEALEDCASTHDPVSIDQDKGDVWNPVVIKCLAEYKRRMS